MTKYVYLFGPGMTEGSGEMVDLLGGKGANLAEMARHPDLLLPVPSGFTITTEVCSYYHSHGRSYPQGLRTQVEAALRTVESLTGRRFGDPENPLLVSVRSGARRSMPGMMETVLNVGLTQSTLQGLIRQTGNERFAYDSYRRLIAMYADVVMEKAQGMGSKQDEGIRKHLETKLVGLRERRGYKLDTEIKAADMREVVRSYRRTVRARFGTPSPDNPVDQLWGAIGAVFASWMGKRAVEYRRIERIPDDWGTAVTIQAMVFGNIGSDSATGVAFTRNPATGENAFYGEYLVNAQGEDVVAGIRIPAPLNEHSRNVRNQDLPTLAKLMPGVYRELEETRDKLEQYYRDVQDIEFTVERGELYILQCRAGKRTGTAAVRIAMDMLDEGLLDDETAVLRVNPAQLVELFLPMLDPKTEARQEPIARGLPAGPGGAVGRVAFTAPRAVALAQDEARAVAHGEKEEPDGVILVREETSPEDVEGIHAARGVLTTKGGMTSHAALVARGWGKCCIVGCAGIEIAANDRSLRTRNGQTVGSGDWISLNGTSGCVYAGKLPLVESEVMRVLRGDLGASESTTYRYYQRFMELAERHRQLGVRANADTPEDAERALRLGAEGIGLFRTEHMFYGRGGESSLFLLRKMIMSSTEEERHRALDELFPFVKADVKSTLEVMEGRPVTIRLLDPPLHEFVPKDRDKLRALAAELGISIRKLRRRVEALREANPMLGHRGVRLGITYPEISEMQIRAILEAAAELIRDGKKVQPEVMIPVTCNERELLHQKAIFDRLVEDMRARFKLTDLPALFGTMIEIPRAALRAGDLAETADFFSFGTNDLTQMTLGFSRDDVGGFLPDYLREGILRADPFQTLDQDGVGELVRLATERGRASRPQLKVGICGEHGGDPESVKFCHKVGLDYVSCSPYRVPTARLAAAQAGLATQRQDDTRV